MTDLSDLPDWLRDLLVSGPIGRGARMSAFGVFLAARDAMDAKDPLLPEVDRLLADLDSVERLRESRDELRQTVRAVRAVLAAVDEGLITAARLGLDEALGQS